MTCVRDRKRDLYQILLIDKKRRTQGNVSRNIGVFNWSLDKVNEYREMWIGGLTGFAVGISIPGFFVESKSRSRCQHPYK